MSSCKCSLLKFENAKIKAIILIFGLLLSFQNAATAVASELETSKECIPNKNIKIPESDRPTASDKKELVHCKSEALYYGIGMPVDFVAARKCAFIEMDAGNELIFGGSSILMTIYANGKGVKRNLDIAFKLACAVEGAPAEVAGRLEHLLGLKTNKGKTDFDLCDDITSEFMMGACRAHGEQIIAVERNKRIKTYHEKLVGKTVIAAFEHLQTKSDSFIEARVNNEVDLSGTARAMFMIEEESILKEDFVQMLEKFSKGKANKYTLKDKEDRDKKLDVSLDKIKKANVKIDENSSMGAWGTVTSEGVFRSQAAWEEYRNAWVDFIKLNYPKLDSSTVWTWLTIKRIHMLAYYTAT